jgi:hypothetical protein
MSWIGLDTRKRCYRNVYLFLIWRKCGLIVSKRDQLRSISGVFG